MAPSTEIVKLLTAIVDLLETSLRQSEELAVEVRRHHEVVDKEARLVRASLRGISTMMDKIYEAVPSPPTPGKMTHHVADPSHEEHAPRPPVVQHVITPLPERLTPPLGTPTIVDKRDGAEVKFSWLHLHFTAGEIMRMLLLLAAIAAFIAVTVTVLYSYGGREVARDLREWQREPVAIPKAPASAPIAPTAPKEHP